PAGTSPAARSPCCLPYPFSPASRPVRLRLDRRPPLGYNRRSLTLSTRGGVRMPIDKSGRGEQTVKRSLVVVAAVTTLGMAAYLASQLFAQAPGAAPAGPTKIGIVNMAVVLKGYNKFAVYNNEIEKIRLQYDKQEKDLEKLLKDWQDYMTKAKDQAERDKAEDAIKTIVRKREDNKNEYAKVRNKKSDEQMVQMYREIEAAVKAYAGPSGYQMVLHYSEPLTEADIYSAPNIQRKLV